MSYNRDLKWSLETEFDNLKEFYILCENILDRWHKSDPKKGMLRWSPILQSSWEVIFLYTKRCLVLNITPPTAKLSYDRGLKLKHRQCLINFKKYNFCNLPKGRNPGIAETIFARDRHRSFTFTFLYKIIESGTNAYLPIQHHTAQSASSVWHGQSPRHQGASSWARRHHSPLSSQALPPWAKHPTDL